MLYIVTPVFNRINFTRQYLESLRNQSVKDFKIIIVDDGSKDGTSKMIEEEYPEIILIKGDGNLWWAEGTNLGIRKALKLGADKIMMLNDDTIPSIDFVEKMLYWSNKYPMYILGAFAIDAITMSPVYGGQIRNYWTGRSKFLLNYINKNDLKGLKEVNIFPGRGLLVNARIFNKIGFFDAKNFPQMVADMDFTTRAYNHGYRIFCNYDAKILIFPDESGGIKLIKNKTIKNFYLHLFSIRGAGNLIWLYKYALKNLHFYQIPSFLLFGVLSKVFSYFKK